MHVREVTKEERVNLRVGGEVLRRMKEAARRSGMGLSEWVRSVVVRALEVKS